MMRHVRHVAVLFLAFLASFAVAEPIQLRFVCWDGDASMPAIRQAAEAFERAHPNIKVKVESVTVNYQEKLLAQFAAGVAPDVAMMDPGNFQKYSLRKAMLPLNGFIKETNYDIGAYYKNIVDAHSLDGQLYVLPRDIAPISIVYYNKRLFDEAGVPYPDGSWTWAYEERPELKEKDFLWVLKKLTKQKDGRNVQWAYAPGWQDLLWQMFALSSGARWADDYQIPTKLKFDDPGVMRAIQFTADLTLKKKWIPTPTEITSVLQSNSRQIFTQQKVAMYQSGIWDVPELRRELVKGKPNYFEWDIAIAPAYKDGTRAFPTGGSGYGIMASTKHPKEAWLLTSWMAGEPGLKLLASTGLAQPAIQRMALSEPWIPGPNTPEDQQHPKNRIITDQSVPGVVFGPLGSEWGDASAIATRVLGQVWDGKAQAKDVLPAENRKAQERMDYLRGMGNLPTFNWAYGSILAVVVVGGLAAWVYAPERKIRRTPREKRENRVAYLFVLPWILGLLLFTAGPMILSLLMSFTDWDIIQAAKWRGLGNYQEALSFDPRFWPALQVTLVYTIVAVPLGLICSLSLALLLNVKVKGMPLWRTCYYLPSVASGVAASLIWKRVFMPDGGLLNAVIYGADGKGNFLGIAEALRPLATVNGQVNWLGNESTSLSALIIMSIWGAGGGMILLLAGLQNVPQYLYEASILDGANPWRRFKAVTVPMISPAIFFSLITGFIGSFQTWTQALLMTDGGPNDSTLFLAFHLYRSGFLSLRMGYASSLAWLLFFVVMMFTLFQLRMSKWVYYEGGIK
ncbi:MAG: extracellular solute-binding protein [Fimbriimonas sp.]